MAIKLYLDEDVDPLLAQVLRDRGADCLSTLEAQNLGRSDNDQLEFATGQGRAILTFNVKDFVRLARECTGLGKHHSGIIVSDHLPLSPTTYHSAIYFAGPSHDSCSTRRGNSTTHSSGSRILGKRIAPDLKSERCACHTPRARMLLPMRLSGYWVSFRRKRGVRTTLSRSRSC